MSNTRSIKEAPSVKNKHVFDLDALEQQNKPRLFVARVGGKDFTFADPYQDDWQDSIAIDMADLEGSLRRLLGDQYEEFKAIRMPMWKMNALNEAVGKHYQKYYGSPGEGIASTGT